MKIEIEYVHISLLGTCMYGSNYGGVMKIEMQYVRISFLEYLGFLYKEIEYLAFYL